LTHTLPQYLTSSGQSPTVVVVDEDVKIVLVTKVIVELDVKAAVVVLLDVEIVLGEFEQIPFTQ